MLQGEMGKPEGLGALPRGKSEPGWSCPTVQGHGGPKQDLAQSPLQVPQSFGFVTIGQKHPCGCVGPGLAEGSPAERPGGY